MVFINIIYKILYMDNISKPLLQKTNKEKDDSSSYNSTSNFLEN